MKTENLARAILRLTDELSHMRRDINELRKERRALQFDNEQLRHAVSQLKRETQELEELQGSTPEDEIATVAAKVVKPGTMTPVCVYCCAAKGEFHEDGCPANPKNNPVEGVDNGI